ncbi:MAG: ATP-binding protein [Bradymonadales bacterium]|nr:ATP-binding protein [Bradymonadales bacterium]
MIDRTMHDTFRSAVERYPVVTVTGPRQSGKTTLCRMAFPSYSYVSLELPDVRSFAQDDPRGFLAHHGPRNILDEVQRAPQLLSYIQPMVDEDHSPGRFILTGSFNLGLIETVSQSLAGRTRILHLLSCGLEEIRAFPKGQGNLFETMWTGGYPAIFDRDLPPREWLGDYVQTYVERDVRQVLKVTDLFTFQRFIALCAGRVGQLVNLSSLSSDAGISHNTAGAWLSVLEASYLLFRVPPMVSNLRKRVLKTSKLHFYDTGLVCYLLGIESPDQLRTHPLRGSIFETWVAGQIIRAQLNRGQRPNLFHYRDRKGDEVDLVLDTGRHLTAIETKSGATIAPDFFGGLKRFASAISTHAEPPQVTTLLIYGGDERQQRTDGLVLPWSEVAEHPWTQETS